MGRQSSSKAAKCRLPSFLTTFGRRCLRRRKRRTSRRSVSLRPRCKVFSRLESHTCLREECVALLLATLLLKPSGLCIGTLKRELYKRDSLVGNRCCCFLRLLSTLVAL